MAKDPTPRADMLRAQREARYGHLQAKATPPRTGGISDWAASKAAKPAKKAKPKKGKKR